MTQYAAQPAGGGVAVQRLSLIQCYINFPIYAALVKKKKKKSKAREQFEVGVRLQLLMLVLPPTHRNDFYIPRGCLSFVSNLSAKRFLSPMKLMVKRKKKKQQIPPRSCLFFFPPLLISYTQFPVAPRPVGLGSNFKAWKQLLCSHVITDE